MTGLRSLDVRGPLETLEGKPRDSLRLETLLTRNTPGDLAGNHSSTEMNFSPMFFSMPSGYSHRKTQPF